MECFHSVWVTVFLGCILMMLQESAEAGKRGCGRINVIRMRQSYRHGQKVTFSFLCGDEERLADGLPIKVTCLDGQWMVRKKPVDVNKLLASEKICVPIACHTASNWKDFLPNLNYSYKTETTIRLVCPANFTLTPYFKSIDGLMVCQTGGIWSVDLNSKKNICRAMTIDELKNQGRPAPSSTGAIKQVVSMGKPVCKELPLPKGLNRLNPGRVRVGKLAVYSCSPGYEFMDGRQFFSARCLPNGKFNVTTVPTCKVVIHCDQAPVVPYSVMTSKAKKQPIGQIVVYTCSKGRRFPDGEKKKYIRCKHNGKWSYKVPNSCKSKRNPKVVKRN